MRKIEQEMTAAIAAHRNWSSGNTQVVTKPFDCTGFFSEVFLHGNHIAIVWTFSNGTRRLSVNTETLAAWPTPTTKSRLRALGADVCHRNNRLYLDGQEVTDPSQQEARIENYYVDHSGDYYDEIERLDEEHPIDPVCQEVEA